jgi:hypothetical protein
MPNAVVANKIPSVVLAREMNWYVAMAGIDRFGAFLDQELNEI